MAENVINKAKLGLKWTVIKTLFSSIVQPFYRILLALILTPSDFAYISVILLIVSFAELLNNVGIGEAVIQREQVKTKDLSTLFFFNIFITAVITVMVYQLSSIIKSYYGMANLDVIVRFLTIIIIINGLTSLFKFYLHKKFFFKETSIINITKVTVEIFMVLVLILLELGIWGFLIGIITSNLINGILLTTTVFKKTDFKIKWYFSFSKLWRFLSFGSSIAAKKILTFFSHRIDEIIIGGILTSDILGAYYLAKNILFQLQTLITTSFGQILLPMFSKIKNNKNKLRYYYIKILKIIGFIGFPVFAGVIITADLFVPVIFGDEWSESIMVFQVLSIAILAELLSASITSSLLYAVNKANLLLIIEIVTISLYVISLTTFNNGTLISILIIYMIYIIGKFIVTQYFIGKQINLRISTYVSLWKGTFSTTLIMVISVISYMLFLDQFINNLFLLITSILLGIIVYISTSLLFNKNNMFEVIKLFKDTILK